MIVFISLKRVDEHHYASLNRHNALVSLSRKKKGSVFSFPMKLENHESISKTSLIKIMFC